MDRRTFLKQGAAAVTAAGLGSQSCARVTRRPSRGARPNIVHITPHDLGRDVACLGHPVVKTPNLDRLGAEGVRFTNHFCASTACSPGRGTTMTGRYAHCNGLMGLVNRGWSMPESERTIVDYLNDAGYETCHVGLQHERRHRRMNRYKVYLGEEKGRKSSVCDVVSGHAIDYLHKRQPGDPPFYLNAAFFECHAPWERPEYMGRYNPDDIVVPPYLPDTPQMRKRLCSFYGSVSFMDECVGKVLDTLRETGLEDDTLVIFTTDHGISFPRAKGTLYDPGMTTALIMRCPGYIKAGTVCEHLVHSINLVPMVLDMLGMPVPEHVQGRSHYAFLSGGGYEPYDQIFLERNFHADTDFVRAVRTARYKYIRNLTDRNRNMIPPENVGVTHWGKLRNSGIRRAPEELFDLEKDPNEFNNVAEDPAYASVLADLRGRLEDWMNETNDWLRGAYELIHFPARDRRI